MRRRLLFLPLALSAGCLSMTGQDPPAAPAPAVTSVVNVTNIVNLTNVMNVTNVVNVMNVVNVTNIVNVTNVVIVTKVIEVTNVVEVLRRPAAPAVPPVVPAVAPAAPAVPPVAAVAPVVPAVPPVAAVAPPAVLNAPPAVKDGSGLVSEEERHGWRVSVGASVIGPVKPNLGVSSARMRELSGFGESLMRGAAARRGGRSRAEAYAAGSGAADGVRRFDGGAWYDPRDAASANDPDWSWNWRLHDPEGADPDGRKGFTERTAYHEERESVTLTTSDDGAGCSRDSSEWFPGLRVELARELYRSEGERPWGADVSAAFAYYFRKGLWRTGGTAASASVGGRRERGYYEWWNDSEDTAQYILDYERDTQFDGGMWGAGTSGGPGAELETSAWRVRDVGTASESWSSAHGLDYRGVGDYREYSIEALARPWWEPWKWLRVFGSVGVEVSRREFRWSLDAWGTDGSIWRDGGNATDWRAFGLLGGGLSVFWRDFTLAGEALWRFGGDDLGVYGRAVSGGIAHGDWGFRMSLGYEF